MKGLENFIDLITMGVGMTGALVKGLKKRLRPISIVTSMVVAGILSFSLIGVVELFYTDLSPKIIILISFAIGWIANELTDLLDESVGELYDYALEWVKNKLKK